MGLAADRGGSGAPLLVLLHGLGATREVWSPIRGLVERHWPGRWIAPDLPGHGRSPPTTDYSPAAQAVQVAALVQAQGVEGEVVVVGHSMGGVVALTLAGGAQGLRPHRVFGLGIKVVWTAAELENMASRATIPPKVFAERDAAIDRYLRIAGLAGLAAPDSAMAAAGVCRTEDGWRLAIDPATHSLGGPDMAALTAAAVAPIHLASGGQDAMSRLEDLRRWDAGAQSLPGLGHNAMVEDPAAVWTWISRRQSAGNLI